MSHPSPGLLVDLARGLSPHADVLRPHLDDCDRCRGALDRLQLLVRVARIGSRVPALAVGDARALAGRWTKAPAVVEPARLVLDDVLPLPTGLRATSREDRHLLFEAAEWAIDLRLQRRDEALSITGQLANAMAPTRGCVGVAILARSPEAVIGRGLTGPLGEFTITCADVSPLTLEIRVTSPAIAIGIPPARG